MSDGRPIETEDYTRLEKQMRYIASIIRITGRQILSNVGITPPQFVALQWVSEEEGITIGELSSIFFLLLAPQPILLIN